MMNCLRTMGSPVVVGGGEVDGEVLEEDSLEEGQETLSQGRKQ